MTFKPTNEQQKIIDLAKTGVDITINAYAGCAKTTTCSLIAKNLVKPSLYLTFNKAMADEARAKMPSHVECRTWHSIAYQYVGLDYQHKLRRPQGAYRNLAGTGGEIARYFKIPSLELSGELGFVGSIMFGIAVKKTLTRFEFSDDDELDISHVDHSVLKKYKGSIPRSDLRNYQVQVVKYAKELWKLRADMNSPVLITHDTYLKLYQLSNPVLDDYEVIYSDEAQDSSLTMVSILNNQKAQKIVVGDIFQKIYGWRGSVDGMGLSSGKVMELSRSFRFGNSVADVANSIIGEGRVEGCDKVTNVHKEMPECYKGKTLLFRTNAALFSHLVTLLQEGYTVNTEVDTKEFRSLVESCLHLMRGEARKVKHEDVQPYKDWRELKMSIKNGVVDGNITNVCRLVESGEYLAVLGAMDNLTKSGNADVLLTTAHKSKGREWGNVVVMNDFPNYNQEGVNNEERNLYYVACTRAIENLYYHPMEYGEFEETGEASTARVQVYEGDWQSMNFNREVSRQMAAFGWNGTGEMEQLAEFVTGPLVQNHLHNHLDDEALISGEQEGVDWLPAGWYSPSH